MFRRAISPKFLCVVSCLLRGQIAFVLDYNPFFDQMFVSEHFCGKHEYSDKNRSAGQHAHYRLEYLPEYAEIITETRKRA